MFTVTRKSSINYWVIGAITSLYVLNTVITALMWLTLVNIPSRNAHLWQSTFEYAPSDSGPDLAQYIQDICKFLLVVIADSIIVSENCQFYRLLKRDIDLALL